MRRPICPTAGDLTGILPARWPKLFRCGNSSAPVIRMRRRAVTTTMQFGYPQVFADLDIRLNAGQ
jgi:hypothetical protein